MPLQIIRADISRVKADAIVNTANPYVGVGAGVDAAIYERAGREELLAARERIGILQPGEVAYTEAFGLDAAYLFHTVAPVWQGGSHGEAGTVKECYQKSLELAKELRCESVAFPLLAAGSCGFPREEALRTAVDCIRGFLERNEMLVYLAVFDEQSFRLSGKFFDGIDEYIDAHYVKERTAEEYKASRPVRGFLRNRPTVLRDEEISGRAAGKKAEGGDGRKRERRPMPVGEAMPAAQAFCAAPRSLEDVIAQLGETFGERLFRMIDERGMTDVEVYKRANLDRKLFSKIRCNPEYRPKKKTALALAIALKLNLDDTRDLLARAELALSPGSRSDLIVQYFIERQVYDIYTINMALFAHGEAALGGG